MAYVLLGHGPAVLAAGPVTILVLAATLVAAARGSQTERVQPVVDLGLDLGLGLGLVERARRLRGQRRRPRLAPDPCTFAFYSSQREGKHRDVGMEGTLVVSPWPGLERPARLLTDLTTLDSRVG